jgi:hypothetical protein
MLKALFRRSQKDPRDALKMGPDAAGPVNGAPVAVPGVAAADPSAMQAPHPCPEQGAVPVAAAAAAEEGANKVDPALVELKEASTTTGVCVCLCVVVERVCVCVCVRA